MTGAGHKSQISVTGFTLVAVLLNLLTACVGNEGRSDLAASSSREIPQSQPEQPAEPDSAPTETLCSMEEQEEIETTIHTQAQLIEAGDWPAAYLWASSLFRASVPAEDFERVVTRQYEQLLYFESASFGRCEMPHPSTAIISVQITSRFSLPVIMRYTMIKEDEQWFVTGVDNPVSAIPNA